MVSRIKPATQAKKLAAKGKAVSQHTTQPRAHKVTCITSLSPGVPVIPAPSNPGPSQKAPLPLFGEPALLRDRDVGGEAPAMSGEWLWSLAWLSD